MGALDNIKTDLIYCYEAGTGENSDRSWDDRTGTDVLNLTVSNPTIVTEATLLGGQDVYEFGGIDGKHNETLLQAAQAPNGFSMACWFKITNPTGANFSELFGSAVGSDTKGASLILDQAEQVKARWEGGQSGVPIFNDVAGSPSGLSNGVWYRTLMSWDGTTDANKGIFYFGGVPYAAYTAALSLSNLFPHILGQAMGIRKFALNKYFYGKLQQVTIWGRAITAAEELALHNLGNGVPYSLWGAGTGVLPGINRGLGSLAGINRGGFIR